jgi:UDP-N-acetylmuramate dehydrogenase
VTPRGNSSVNSDGIATALELSFPGIVSRDVSLAKSSRWRVGGQADVIVRPQSLKQLCELRAYLLKHNLKSTVIGATSNLLFADEGLRCVAIDMASGFDLLRFDNRRITVGAGVWVPQLARVAMKAGLSGIEHICGIPGTLGGLICMNGGSQRRGIGEVVETITSVDKAGVVRIRDSGDCGFAYRTSLFQSIDDIVVEASIALTPTKNIKSDRGDIRRTMLAIMANRREKFPKQLPNCGSVFVSNPAMYAAYGPPGAVIERLGFKGMRVGGAEVSLQHANFIVNAGAATAADILSLITIIRASVREATGYEMAVEARFVRPDGKMVPAYGAPTEDF